jgi:hypothetical protein
MADGLPGHLHEFYRLVKDAPWLGGDQEYSCMAFNSRLGFHDGDFTDTFHMQGSMKHGHIRTMHLFRWPG